MALVIPRICTQCPCGSIYCRGCSSPLETCQEHTSNSMCLRCTEPGSYSRCPGCLIYLPEGISICTQCRPYVCRIPGCSMIVGRCSCGKILPACSSHRVFSACYECMYEKAWSTLLHDLGMGRACCVCYGPAYGNMCTIQGGAHGTYCWTCAKLFTIPTRKNRRMCYTCIQSLPSLKRRLRYSRGIRIKLQVVISFYSRLIRDVSGIIADYLLEPTLPTTLPDRMLPPRQSYDHTLRLPEPPVPKTGTIMYSSRHFTGLPSSWQLVLPVTN